MRVLLLLFIMLPLVVSAQQKAKKMAGNGEVASAGNVFHAHVIDGDTIPMVYLQEFRIAERRVWPNPQDAIKWERLKKKVIKVYPYAKLARLKMEALSLELDTLDRKKDKKKFIKHAEKSIFDEFEDDIKDMTVSEGVVLIKLIDRETGDSSFELVKELKGSLNAFMWQSVARIFGHNLKTKYDPHGEDKMIEEIVLMIERGEL